MTCYVVMAVTLAFTPNIVWAIDEDLIDPYQIAQQFTVDCGTSDNKKMDILFRGNAHSMYSRENHKCIGKELGAAHLGIEDAYTNPYCAPYKTPGMEVYVLSVVIQKGHVRMYDDPYYLITCSYELMGSQDTDTGKQVDDSNVVIDAPIVQVSNETSLSNVTLVIRDQQDSEVRNVSLGDYIQLVAFMEPGPGEVSFRMWNCRALSLNESGTQMEHHILFRGCGDNRLIRMNRGFLTSQMRRDDGSVIRVARSVFFRAFTFLLNPDLRFECDYIVSKDDSADGPSCGISGALP